MLSVKKVVVVVSLAVGVFGGAAAPAAACSPADGWTGCWQEAQSNAQANYSQAAQGWQQAGEYTGYAAQWAVGQAGGAINGGAQSWNNSNGGAWTLPSGASAPLQAGYDAATNYAANYSK